MNEQTIFKKGPVTITNVRAVFGGKTYAMATVQSVAIRTKQESGCAMAIALGFGISALSLGIIDSLTGTINWIFLLTGVFFTAIGVLALFRFRRKRYIVVIGTTSGEDIEVDTPSRDYALEVCDSINAAIIARG